MASSSSFSVNGHDRTFFPSEMKGINSDEAECYGDSGDLISAEEICSHLGSKAGESTSADLDRHDESESESVNNSAPELVDSLETEWTDEKHSSYLDSIEASFVKKMYDREYCSLDLCGQTPKEMEALDSDCAESRLNFPSPFNEFKVWQKGCWRTLPDYGKFQRCSFPRGVGSTWIQHFKAPVSSNKKKAMSTVNESHRNDAVKRLVLKQPGSRSVEMEKAPNEGMHTWGQRLCSNYSGSASPCEERKARAARDGKFISTEVTDWNFKDEAKTERRQHNAASEADQNPEDHVKRETSPKKQKLKVYIDGGCKSPEDQVVPFLGSANAEEAGDCNYPSKIQGFSANTNQQSDNSINFLPRENMSFLKLKQLSRNVRNFSEDDCSEKLLLDKEQG
ncbi:hypothetical protein KI387_018959 [Taxus chinensis]|uniref:Uncharacterized protein n=1 Tax=Taxus chinensis TaxID=29808 RepID=A0AA38G8E3_TAXCH|nr:hypothetical protein KI387_018959 [Taxus chinensis]